MDSCVGSVRLAVPQLRCTIREFFADVVHQIDHAACCRAGDAG